MSTTPQLNLFNLLPSIYQIRDANQGGALQNLFAILQDAHDAVGQDITNLYENWFIETCAEWVVPYIGDLLGVAPLNTADIPGVTARAYVAHTLSYRQRKGTPIVLQQLAQDVTNWPACAVQFFQLLATTQYMNHLRLQNLAAPDLRNVDPLQLIGGPFDSISRTVDVRGIVGPAISVAQTSGPNPDTVLIRGKYNLPNIGLFVWRLKSYAIEGVTPREVMDGTNTRYRFNPIGLDEPLYNQPTPPAAAFIPVTGEVQVPGALRRLALYEELETRRQTMVDQQMVWQPGVNYALGFEIVDSNGNTERVTAGGISGASAPAWTTTLSDSTGDGGVTWQLVMIGAALPATYFGEQPVLAVIPNVSGSAIPPEQIMICDLSNLNPPATPGTWRVPAASKTYTRASDGAQITLPLQAAVDPVLGRLVLVKSPPEGPSEVRVNYSYGFSGDMGGGTYNRSASIQALLSGVDQQLSTYWQVAVSQELAPVAGLVYPNVTAAVQAWNSLPALPSGSQRFGVIVLLDNASYNESLTGTNTIVIPEASSLLIVSSDWPSLTVAGSASSFQLSPAYQRTHLIGDITVEGTAPEDSENPGSLLLSGVLIEGSVYVSEGNLGTLSIADSTIVPAVGQITVAPSSPGTGQNASLTVTLQNTICGPIVLPAAQFSGLTLNLTNCVIDGGWDQEEGVVGVAINALTADANIQSTTVIGTVGPGTAAGLRTLQAGNCIFTATVTVERKQAGCVRYCSLPTDTSMVPRRFNCQPDLALANVTNPADQLATRERLTPSFTSTSYGDPGYCQLSSDCAMEIRAGADVGSEMGAFYFLNQPQRDSNLRSVLPQYLRFGMQAGIFYVT
jgi:hypothetical protein